MIGRHSHLYGQNYRFGIIDDVLIYDRVLSPEEIDVLASAFTSTERQSWGGVKATFR